MTEILVSCVTKEMYSVETKGKKSLLN